MNKMKKLRAFLLAAVMALCVASVPCGAQEAVKAADGSETKETAESTTKVSKKKKAKKKKKKKKGWYQKNYKTFYYKKGRKVTGWRKIDEKLYYFGPKGVLQKNKIVPNSDNKYFYVDSDGVLVVNGAIQYAVNFVMENSDPMQTPLQRLRSCYDALCRNPYQRFYSDQPGADQIESYALYMFRNGKGNCYRYGSALAYIARVLGFESRVSAGGVTAYTYTNLSPHGWCEVKVDGVWKLCDCSMQRAHQNNNLFLVEWNSYPFRIRCDHTYTMQSAQGAISWV